MLFVSYEFLLFLPLSLLLYYLTPGRWQWVILLGASLLFYASPGAGYLAFLLTTWVSVYCLSLIIEGMGVRGKGYIEEKKLVGKEKRVYRARIKKQQTLVLLIAAAMNLGILLTVKYTNFAIWNYNWLMEFMGTGNRLEPVKWLLPLGISYYTLQALGYLIDIFHEKYRAEKNPFRLLLFLSFFPQVVQGPVSRFEQLKKTLFQRHGWDWQRISLGFQRMLWGFFKKLVAADRAAPVVMAVAGNSGELDGVYVLAGMLAYTLQLYGDFTGGIDIAIGCAQMFGVELTENFRTPFASLSLAEYWRRWHMSLMQWFREYVFYPLAGSKAAGSAMKAGEKLLGRKAAARIPVYAASLITWFLTGIWHGASWNFVVWGLVNCMILLISQEAAPLYRRLHKRLRFTESPAYRRFMAVRTMLLVSAVQIFEYYPSPHIAAGMFLDMFGSFHVRGLLDKRASLLGITMADFVVLILCVLLFGIVGRIGEREPVRGWIRKKCWFVRFLIWFGLILSVLVFGVYGQGYDAGQFIYNQF